ncbi:molybdenum cofactor guanylyltransferase [Virgibacillus kekensis]|uniref:Probable molybdenum cofactor guanylyltransferase n=1 Tax=Virgibacillus kekensis TaxID=202261 RepID=A0ABV9DGC3_9BACI
MRKMGVVLAGGKSSRMGTDKSLLSLNGKPVIQHVVSRLKSCSDEVCIIANNPASYSFLNTPVYPDRYKEKGPLAGIESALYNTDADVYICAACDMPFVHASVYEHLLGLLEDADAVIPVYPDKMHPLSAIYTKYALPPIQELLDKDIRKVRRLFDRINVNYAKKFGDIPDETLSRHFFNMNYPDQYEEANQF